MVFPGKKEGFYLDIGGNDPITINNTYYFEKLGWKGVAVEPQTFFADQWKKKRTTECLCVAVGEKNRKVFFTELEEKAGSGVSAVMKEKGVQYEIQQRTVNDILQEKGIIEVDFVSIDVEGYEMQVLKGIDFSRVVIKCFVIENNKRRGGKPNTAIRKYLYKRGYKLFARLTIDDVFIKND